MSLCRGCREGLAQVAIIAEMIFSGISGSMVADEAALGPIEMKAMTEKGYERNFSAAVIVSSTVLGPIIPPSIIFIIYAISARISIAKMFLAGIVPGLIIAAFMMVWIYYVASHRKREMSSSRKADEKTEVEWFPWRNPGFPYPFHYPLGNGRRDGDTDGGRHSGHCLVCGCGPHLQGH